MMFINIRIISHRTLRCVGSFPYQCRTSHNRSHQISHNVTDESERIRNVSAGSCKKTTNQITILLHHNRALHSDDSGRHGGSLNVEENTSHSRIQYSIRNVHVLCVGTIRCTSNSTCTSMPKTTSATGTVDLHHHDIGAMAYNTTVESLHTQSKTKKTANALALELDAICMQTHKHTDCLAPSQLLRRTPMFCFVCTPS